MTNNSRIKGFWRLVFVFFSFTGVAFAVNQIFQINPTCHVVFTTRYLFILIACFIPLNFLISPATKKAPKDYIPWYDIVLFVLSTLTCLYFVYYSVEIALRGWAFTGGPFSTFMSFLLMLFVIEAMRRRGNKLFLIVSLVMGSFPLYAERMPKIFAGKSYNIWQLARNYVMGDQALLGIPVQAFGNLVIGFIIFGVILEISGASKFFFNIASSLLGKSRGGSSKIACMASGLFGTMSGDPLGNIMTTGPIILPAMKESGYTKIESGGLLACAATGGMLAPPVMGLVAFIMAAWVGESYATIAICASFPALIYYLSLVIQMDFIAARRNIPGINMNKIPSFKKCIKTDWIYIVSFTVLIYFMLVARLENQAAFYGSAALIIGTSIYREKRINFFKLIDMFEKIGTNFSYLLVMVMTVGFIIGAFFLTGVGPLLARTIMSFAGGNLYILLILTAVLCYILGMGMPTISAYIFLAITVSPILEKAGLDMIASHLFILYWALFSFMTPPVALAAFTAAALVDANPMKVGFKSMGFAAILYFIPFFFVLNPIMILRGEVNLLSVATVWATSIVGVILVAGGLQGYMFFLGPIPKSIYGHLIRIAFIGGGFLLVVPYAILSSIGLLLTLLGIGLFIISNKIFKEFNDNSIKETISSREYT